MAIKSSKAGKITKTRELAKRKRISSKATSLKSKKLMPLIKGRKIALKSIPKKKILKSKPFAIKQGKAVSMKSKSEKTSMKSKPFALKQGKTVSMRSHPKKTNIKSKPFALKQGKAVSMKSKSEKTSMKSKPFALKQGKAVSMRSQSKDMKSKLVASQQRKVVSKPKPRRDSTSELKSAGPFEKVKQFWNDLTSPSTKKSSDGSQMKIKINAKKEDRLSKTRKASAGTKKITRNSRKKVSMKASRDLKGTSSRNFVRDARGRFKSSKKVSKNSKMVAAKHSKATKKMSSKRSSGETDESKTIYLPIQQGSNGKTAEAIVVNNQKHAKKQLDVKDVKIIED